MGACDVPGAYPLQAVVVTMLIPATFVLALLLAGPVAGLAVAVAVAVAVVGIAVARRGAPVAPSSCCFPATSDSHETPAVARSRRPARRGRRRLW